MTSALLRRLLVVLAQLGIHDFPPDTDNGDFPPDTDNHGFFPDTDIRNNMVRNLFLYIRINDQRLRSTRRGTGLLCRTWLRYPQSLDLVATNERDSKPSKLRGSHVACQGRRGGTARKGHGCQTRKFSSTADLRRSGEVSRFLVLSLRYRRPVFRIYAPCIN